MARTLTRIAWFGGYEVRLDGTTIGYVTPVFRGNTVQEPWAWHAHRAKNSGIRGTYPSRETAAEAVILDREMRANSRIPPTRKRRPKRPD